MTIIETTCFLLLLTLFVLAIFFMFRYDSWIARWDSTLILLRSPGSYWGRYLLLTLFYCLETPLWIHEPHQIGIWTSQALAVIGWGGLFACSVRTIEFRLSEGVYAYRMFLLGPMTRGPMSDIDKVGLKALESGRTTCFLCLKSGRKIMIGVFRRVEDAETFLQRLSASAGVPTDFCPVSIAWNAMV